jgi:CRP-like cAMP-binding protein
VAGGCGIMTAPMASDLEALLLTAPAFRRLDPEDQARLASVARLRMYTRGEMVFREGEAASHFVTVAKGRVKIVKTTPTGRDVILEILGIGDPVGAVALYEGRPFPASAVALEDTTCVLLPRDAFFALLERHPTMVRGLLAGLTHRLVDLTNRVAEHTGGRVEPRFARLSLKLAQELGRPGSEGTVIPVPLSRQELADMAATTIETTIRIMSRWGKQGVVRTDKDGFVILDARELETLATA